MRERGRSVTALAVAIALMVIVALPAVAVGGDRRSAPMQELTMAGPGAVIVGTSVTVNATAESASIRVRTRVLVDGNAYTIWSFSFSNPGACVGGCGFDDSEDRPGLTGFAVNQVAGQIVGNGDRANLAGSIKVSNADGAEYHIVVADHGPKSPSDLPLQIKSPAPGVQIGIILP